MKPLAFVLVVVLCTIAPAQSHSTQLMTPPEYKDFLDKVATELPGVESALKRVDPAKTNASYAAGAQIVQFRDLGLEQIGLAQKYTAKNALGIPFREN